MSKESHFKQTEIGLIPEDWEVVSTVGLLLPEKGALKIGPFGSQLRKEFLATKGFKLYGQENIFENDFSLGDRYITKERFEFLRSCELRPGDLIISMMGTIGFVTIVPEGIQRGIMDSHLLRLRIDHTRFSAKFLLYAFRSKLVQNQIDSLSVGSIMAGLSSRIIRMLVFPIPPLSEQQSIAKILYDLDSKIELNHRMNKTLEAIGQAIFKRWFVDFEFPSEEGKPYKLSGGEMVYNDELESLVPKDWEVTSFRDILSLLKDGTHTPPRRVESGIKFIAGATDVKHFDIDFAKCTYITKEDYSSIHKYWEVKANDVLLTIVGTVGNVAIVKKEDLPFSLQRSIAILRAGTRISYLFLYFLLNSWRFKQFLLSRVNPTAQPGVYLGTLSEFNLCIPPSEIVKKFSDAAELIIVKMQKNNFESRVLMQIRDIILPKLMSGKLRVGVPKENAEAQQCLK